MKERRSDRKNTEERTHRERDRQTETEENGRTKGKRGKEKNTTTTVTKKVEPGNPKRTMKILQTRRTDNALLT